MISKPLLSVPSEQRLSAAPFHGPGEKVPVATFQPVAVAKEHEVLGVVIPHSWAITPEVDQVNSRMQVTNVHDSWF